MWSPIQTMIMFAAAVFNTRQTVYEVRWLFVASKPPLSSAGIPSEKFGSRCLALSQNLCFRLPVVD